MAYWFNFSHRWCRSNTNWRDCLSSIRWEWSYTQLFSTLSTYHAYF